MRYHPQPNRTARFALPGFVCRRTRSEQRAVHSPARAPGRGLRRQFM